MNIVDEAIVDEGDDVTNLDHDTIRQLTVPEVDTSLGLSIKAYPEGLPEGYALIRRPRLVSTEGTVGCIMCAMNFVAICP